MTNKSRARDLMILGERLMLEKQGKKAMDLKKEKKRASEKGKVRVREG